MFQMILILDINIDNIGILCDMSEPPHNALHIANFLNIYCEAQGKGRAATIY